ncbi:hypothetical protein [Dietzia natronolimnaea]|uniref:hypothetical protein n=1 Tax=Dietzia natronolimnaea TaxID=161920 RepID=UPI0015FD006A|nr:hypothetical protein [Dietzia natronolimnaea]MBB1037369.1 hypothetical protein [Dietzia natronolimnaea]
MSGDNQLQAPADDLSQERLSEQTMSRYEADNGSALAIRSLDDISRLSKIFIQSGMMKGDKSVSQAQQVYQAGVKIIAGVEFGIQPFAAIRGINIINGNAEMSANLMAAKVKKHPKYDYRVKQWDTTGCVITFFEIPYPGAPRDQWDELGDSSFNEDDAKAAGLLGNQNWRKFPRNMYFARAISNGVRIYTPDVFYGAPVYVEGEISGEFESKSDEAPEATPPAKPNKAEAVEGEVVIGDEPSDPLEDKLDRIAELSEELGHGPDWFVAVSEKIRNEADADKILQKLQETKAERLMSDD